MTEGGSGEASQYEARLEQVRKLKEGGWVYPDTHIPTTLAMVREQAASPEQLAEQQAPQTAFQVAGRLMSKRLMGRIGFADLQDGTDQLQIYADQPDILEQLREFSLGDILRAEGELFYTKTQTLSLKLSSCSLLVKCLRPLPEKHAGLQDAEVRHRQRYLDMLSNSQARDMFRQRSDLLRAMREFLDDRRFQEVETPMLHPIPGGATARPFKTWHNALGQELYLRVAPELYLKRLLVGGLDRVYEINRNFRNEGVSTHHNPEFTMLEFYRSYAGATQGMEDTEALIRQCATALKSDEPALVQGQPWRRVRMAETVASATGLPVEKVEDPNAVASLRAELVKALKAREAPGEKIVAAEVETWGRCLFELFELLVEPAIKEPTFVVEYPAEVSPLAKTKPGQPEIADRWELFYNGMELANGFSELNDPQIQDAYFKDQLLRHERGDEEAMYYDADYIRALEYGMPPASGVGIGVDRVLMALTGAKSIRDVIAFPAVRSARTD